MPNRKVPEGPRRKRTDIRGYVLVSCKGYHGLKPGALARRNYDVLEHRMVMEQKLGRHLLPDEIVHHINRNKSDNRPENLEVWNKTHPNGSRDDLIAENLKLKTLVSQLRTCVEA